MGGSDILGSAPFGAYEKGTKLLGASCAFSEFGTCCRCSYHSQDLVVGQLVRAEKDHPGRGKLLRMSNVRRRQLHLSLLGIWLILLCRCTLHRSTTSIPLLPSHSKHSALFCLLRRLLI